MFTTYRFGYIYCKDLSLHFTKKIKICILIFIYVISYQFLSRFKITYLCNICRVEWVRWNTSFWLFLKINWEKKCSFYVYCLNSIKLRNVKKSVSRCKVHIRTMMNQNQHHNIFLELTDLLFLLLMNKKASVNTKTNQKNIFCSQYYRDISVKIW